MTATQATAMSILMTPVAAVPAGTVQQDTQSSSDGGWQRALETASQDARPTSVAASEASYLLALGNLHAEPVEVLPSTTTWTSTSVLPARQDSVPQGVGDGPKAQQHVQSTAAMQRAQADTRASSNSSMTAELRLVEETTSASVASRRSASAASRDDAKIRNGLSSAPKHAVSTETDTNRPGAAMRQGSTFAAAAMQAITAYAAAMSGAPVPNEREADFSFIPRSMILPVRVHVQWCDRVADVWIGLHRKAFDQLPDIRAGVEDWVTARGGVLGHVICNGETLARIAPSFIFQGAL